MDLLLILTYAAICVAIFKLFRIPLNKWTVPTAVLGGIVMIGALIFTMNYNHPYSEVARSYFVSVPVIPAVTGQVIEVPVKGNQPLEKGDVLFRIDPAPFEYRVRSLKATLISKPLTHTTPIRASTSSCGAISVKPSRDGRITSVPMLKITIATTNRRAGR